MFIIESEEECKEVLDKAENPAQRAESIINHLVQQTKVYHEDIIKLNKRIEITENEKDIKETLYIKLSEEYKIVLEERDLVKEELDEMRKKVWDLETKIAQQQEDNSSIHYAVCSNAQHIPETNEKICQRLKEKEELLKKQLKEISGKYELTCQENCLLQSKILELNSSIEELKHKHDLEINNLTEGHKETSSKLKTQSRMVLDLEERTKQLSDCNILEQQKYSTKVKELSGELELFEFKSSKNEKEKESIELENMRLNNFISKQQEENEKLKEENRKLIKERGKLSKKIRELEEPNNYEHLIENSMDIKTMISKCGEYKKRFLKEKEQKDKVEKVMKDCIDKISKTVLNDDGKVIDWKRNFKLKKLEVIQKSQQINDLETQNCSLQKEIELKDKAIQNMINLGLTEFCESKEKLPKYSEIKESFEQMGLLETDLKCEKENNSNLKSIIKSRDEQIIELNKELKRLRDKVLDLYNRLKQGPNHPTLNALGIESLISQESEIEVSRLNKRVLHLEKENRDYLSKLSEKQSEYESIIQKNNLTSSELQTTKQELNRYQQKCESLSKILIDKDQRIQQLTTERTNMNMKIKDIELKNLEDKFKESQDLVITNLKAENELYKKILNSSKGGQLSSSSTDIAVIQKREIDLLRENDKLKQKIYSFKQMIKEYDILLSIFKEKSKDNEDNLAFKRLMALDDPQTEELMLKVRDQIEVCVHKLKQSFDVAYPRKTDESMNLMEQRISDLNTEKSNLLNLFSQQESSYKSTIELNHKEAFKLKETLRKTLESKSVLESKLKSTTASLESAVNQINSLKAQESSLISSFKEQIQEKDFQLHTNLSQSALQIDLLNCKINSLNSELSSESEKFNSTLLEISKNLKTQEDSVQVLTSRLKLKEEEIYELKSNYESQIDSLTSEESKVPIPSLRIFPSTPVSSSVPPPAAKIHDLQQKIHILTDKLFTAKDEIILLQTALEGEKAARSEQIQKLQETYEFSLKSEKEKMEEMVKKSGEEIKAEKQQEIGKLKADLNAMAKEMEVGKSRERNTGGERLKEAERKLKEQEERRGVENVRTMKMMAMLNKAKKLIDNKDKEIEELKKSAEGKD